MTPTRPEPAPLYQLIQAAASAAYTYARLLRQMAERAQATEPLSAATIAAEAEAMEARADAHEHAAWRARTGCEEVQS
jgi:hypothetical protein